IRPDLEDVRMFRRCSRIHSRGLHTGMLPTFVEAIHPYARRVVLKYPEPDTPVKFTLLSMNVSEITYTIPNARTYSHDFITRRISAFMQQRPSIGIAVCRFIRYPVKHPPHGEFLKIIH